MPDPYVTVTHGVRGYFAVLLTWEEDCKMYTPWNSGFGSYSSVDAAVPEAKDWAIAEGISFIHPTES